MSAASSGTRRALYLVTVAAVAWLAAPATPRDLVVVARLDAIPPSVGCGILHTGAVATYSDITVLEGTYRRPTLRVVHGCPEIPRSEYAAGSGDLDVFRAGDYHRLVLTRENVYRIGTIADSDETGRGQVWFCRTVTRAVAP